MRFIIIFVLCAPLILISANDISENEISLDERNGNEVTHRVIEMNESDGETEYLEHEESFNLKELYEHSVQAYLDEDWDGCIEGFTQAIKHYKEYKNALIACRKDCRAQTAGFQPIFPYDPEDFHFYEKKIRETLCMMKFSQNYRDLHGEDSLKRLPEAIEKKFAAFAAYEYLQMCYYQKNRFQDAANAVFTYLTLHPKHEMSLKNLRFYIDQRDVDESEITNLEAEPFTTFYASGVKAYDEERYEDVIKYFEKSLDLYMASEEDCRYYCEGPFNQGWLPEFVPSVANHFTYCIKCKQGCSKRMNQVNGEYYADLLPSHYHYLQFAYYKVGDLKNACAAVSSYLLFYPSDQLMLKNEEYYSKLPKIEEDYFTPREEAVEYVKRKQYEEQLLRYIFEEFLILKPHLDPRKLKKELNETEGPEEKLTHHPPPGHSPARKKRLSNETQIWKNAPPEADNSLTNTNGKIRIIADESDLGGELRYLAEGFLDDSECQSLVNLAQ
ncbi:cartilage-associated protein-like isoform X2 [Venturia canescens]|nr:cartilage-associated protein-like isoform X2 [Venturia canescens]